VYDSFYSLKGGVIIINKSIPTGGGVWVADKGRRGGGFHSFHSMQLRIDEEIRTVQYCSDHF
jgi:hypothetical protein